MTPSPERSGWAKAPTFADDPARREALAARTRRDRARHLDEGLHEIACRACDARVLVTKASPSQTSVQWTAQARAACPALHEAVAAGADPALVPTCAQLSSSIDRAVTDGVIPPSRPSDGSDPHPHGER